MKTVNSHNSNIYASTCGVVTVLLFGILVISCNTSATTPKMGENAPEIVFGEPLNINSATATELERLPGVGPKLAQAIIAFRARNGPFQRTEHLILVPGMSEARFRVLRPMVKIN